MISERTVQLRAMADQTVATWRLPSYGPIFPKAKGFKVDILNYAGRPARRRMT